MKAFELTRFYKLAKIACSTLLLDAGKSSAMGAPMPQITTVLHLHYPGMVGQAMRKLNSARNIGPLIVTTSNHVVASKFRSHGTDVILVENKGRNFGALLQDKVLSQVNTTYVRHIHAKVSPRARVFGRIWGLLLWKRLLNSDLSNRYIKKSLDSEMTLGFPDLSGVFKKSTRTWGLNDKFLKKLPAPEEQYCREVEILTFPMGGMFLCTKELLLELKRLKDISGLEFADEPIGDDGELPHFLERLIGVVACSRGKVIFT